MFIRSIFRYISNIHPVRFSFVCVFFLQSLLIFSQSSGGKINSEEKQRLENKFEALGDYYIDDSGIVVYRMNSEVKIKKDSDANGNGYNQKTDPIEIHRVAEEKTDSEIRPSKKRNVKVENVSTKTTELKQKDADSNPGYYYNNSQKRDVTTNKISPKRTISSEQPVETVREDVVVVDRTLTNKEKKKPVENITTKSKEVSSPSKAPTNDGGSILNRRRKSQYKNMEEAALAVEALIEDLKKEQAAYTNSGSMSSRLSQGVTKDLRKKSEIIRQTSKQEDKTTYEVESSVETTDFNNEPSYFINGVQVDKMEVNKLRRADIINREIRVRNTITGNPNGEIWYDVKTEAIQP